ncbi:zinc finger protein ZXDC isoform X4 [Sciurus carolinensis]|uniref:zinc finger protein ZXDC isoform X4 n=1 Tax=Sciurus carolinensis TaxID=30640 RepID=UPI001FB51B02|nr:zinc finger protein ZXDC isoform X4 [Sciurus carolinensis]
MPGRGGPLFLRGGGGGGSNAAAGPKMDLPALLAAPTARGGQHGGGVPGRLRRGPGPPLSAGPGRRRLLLLRGPEDGGPEPRREEAPGPSPPSPEDGGDSFVVLLEVARGAAAEAPGRREAEPDPGASPAGRPEPGPSGPATAPGAALAGTVTIDHQDLLVRFDHGVFTLAAAPPPAPGPPALGPPAQPGAESPGLAGGRRGPPGAGSGAPGYRCPEPQCALAFAKKHQLKVHLLTHGGLQGRRPFKCPLDGCGWAFTTSYKLKRHLQSHDKLRPFGCPVGGCGKKFTTVYNLKAHMKGHEQESLFKCEVCTERFPTHAKLSSHQRSHFEPERPYKCDFPGCEKTFITVSALFSHNRAHFREQELFSCSFPGCSKQYDKACRLKIHLRSHTGERPFICDSDSCGWTFTSMSKLLRHKRKHDDDRRFTCPVEGCGKSFTRAEHLKGHSITHLGTKPFECPVEGCCARFSARSSLYIHSKKHLQDVGAPKSRCPVSSCNRLFTSKHSMKAHVVRQHGRRQDLVPQLETPSSLTPSSELSSPGQSELTNIDLAALFSDAPAGGSGSAAGSDEALNSGILTIDVTSVSSSLGGNLPASNNSLGPMDPLVLVAHSDIPPSLDSPLILGTAATVLQPGSFSVDDVHTVSTGPVGCLVALPVGQDPTALTSSGNLAAHVITPTSSSTSQETASVPELLASVKVERDSSPVPAVVKRQQGSPAPPPPVFSGPAEKHSAQDSELSAGPGGLYLESGGSARTDYRAIQLAKEKKQKGAGSHAGASESTQRKRQDDKLSPGLQAGRSSCLCGTLPGPSGGARAPAPAAGLQCIQIPVLQPVSLRLCKLLPLLGLTHQDEPSGEGVLPPALGPQPLAFHPYFALDLPVYVFQVGVYDCSSFPLETYRAVNLKELWGPSQPATQTPGGP